jgi:hypothetical protein
VGSSELPDPSQTLKDSRIYDFLFHLRETNIPVDRIGNLAVKPHLYCWQLFAEDEIKLWANIK